MFDASHRKPVRWRIILTLCTALAMSGLAPLAAQADAPAKLVPFGTFLHGLSTARSADFIGHAGFAVKSDADFEEIRAHLHKIYDGQSVPRSFVRDGQTLDCMALDQQPAMRIGGVKSIAAPPPFSPQEALHTPPSQADAFAGLQARAHAVSCPTGSFAMPRMTLEQIAHFGSLHAFFEKGPDDAGRVHMPGQKWQTPNTNGHAYSYAYQNVNNWGGQSVESLYSPYVNTSVGEGFSLEQNWYVGGSGSATQTAEVGWQNYPALYGNESARLFGYYTADNYQHTGCYNYSCGAFVAYGSAPISLGEAWTTYSTPGGSQYIITIGYYLYQGNWWLAYGTGWVGYYPGSVYNGGQMSRNAQLIEYGTESTGSTVWPGEGSGYFAANGWPYSAYQRTIEYRSSNGAFNYPSLTSVQPSPSCYTDTNQTWGGSTWQYYFYLGGPGGRGC